MTGKVVAICATGRLLKWAMRSAACFLLAFSTAYASGWVSRMPADWPDQDLSQALLYRLSHADTRCIVSAVDEYPGFTDPPWQTLDPSQHLNLIAKLLGYEGGPDTMTNRQWSAKLQAAKEFVHAGGTLKIWQTRLLTFFDSNAQFPVPPGDQTIALLSRKYGSYCSTHPSVTQSETFVVLPDLSGPDPRVKHGTVYDLATSYPVLYKGRTLLVSQEIASVSKDELNDGSSITIYQLVKETGVHSNVCWFWYNGNNQNSREK